jgi:hypothetical protein
MVAGDLFEPVPGRDQEQTGDERALPYAGRCRDAGAQRFADDHEGCAVALMSESNRSFGIGDQAFFAEVAGARAVTRILGEDDAQADAAEYFGVELAVPGVAGIAMENDRRGACRRRRFGQQTAKVQPAWPGRQPIRDHLGHARLIRVVQQTILKHGASGENEQITRQRADDHDPRRRRQALPAGSAVAEHRRWPQAVATTCV